jgi:hypothetical protein
MLVRTMASFVSDNGSSLDVVQSNTPLVSARRMLGVLNEAGDAVIMHGFGAKAIINDGQGSSESFNKHALVYAAGDHMTTNAPNGGETCLVVGFTLVDSDDPAYDFNTASVPIFVALQSPVTI